MNKTIVILIAVALLNIAHLLAQIEQTAECGKTVVVTATPSPGYRFLYWSDDTTNTNPVREVPVTKDLQPITDYEAVFVADTTETFHRPSSAHQEPRFDK